MCWVRVTEISPRETIRVIQIQDYQDIVKFLNNNFGAWAEVEPIILANGFAEGLAGITENAVL